ncbi:MAG: hypothetical protein OXI88_22525 [Gammaproteobacteria bacterium]|nr:hypothetical protein [Gammaproteobacteria bacterium]MDE0514544.1 hypothetical protein [Gammaproteobacteria bacterium]
MHLKEKQLPAPNLLDDIAERLGAEQVFLRNRIGGLPRDEARQFLKSHRSRLENLEKARLMGIDKALIGVRKKNLAMASASYIELQEIALVDPEPEPENN